MPELLLKVDLQIFLQVISPLYTKYKRYFIINQQIAQHFVHYSECLCHPFPSMKLKIVNPFLTSRIPANHDKVLEF